MCYLVPPLPHFPNTGGLLLYMGFIGMCLQVVFKCHDPFYSIQGLKLNKLTIISLFLV